MQIHRLKCDPVYFDATMRGEKPFEVRKDDRAFQKGDIVILQRTDPEKPWQVELGWPSAKAKYQFAFRIGYILTGGRFGIEAGYVVLAHDLSEEGRDVARAALNTEAKANG